MGGLATNTTSLLMGGNANLNLLSFKGVGMLEFSFGKDGIKSKIGMGGTNISIQNLVGAFGGATNLHKNSQINKTGYDKTVLDALRSQWGFGDKTAKKQLEEIIRRDTILKFDAKGSEVAQSITENGQKIIHINSSQNEGFIDLGLTLQHEAHRDGIISDKQGQYIETVNAVAGHTKMALAMTKDSLYTKEMLNHISSDSNLQNDINAYMYAAYTGNTSLFAGYVGASYDTSADYWRVLSNGNIIWDGQFDLVDENGTILEFSNSNTLYDSYAQFMKISYEEAKDFLESDSLNISFKNGKILTYNSETGKYDIDRTNDESFYFETSQEFKVAYDFQVNYADKVWENFGGSMEVALSSFKTNYELGNGLISNETLQGLDLVSGFNQYAKQYDKYMIAYYNEKLNMQYDSNDSRAAIKEIDKIITTGDFNDNNPVYNALGPMGILNPIGSDVIAISTRSVYLDKNGNFDGNHGWGNPRGFAIDLSTLGRVGYNVYSNTNSFLYSNSVNSNNPLNLNTGNEVRLFGNNNTIIYGHLQSNSVATIMLDNLSNLSVENNLWRSYIPAGTQIGNSGNTGKTTGPHLHWEYRQGYQFWNNRSN
jgi:hypothetical protein